MQDNNRVLGIKFSNDENIGCKATAMLCKNALEPNVKTEIFLHASQPIEKGQKPIWEQLEGQKFPFQEMYLNFSSEAQMEETIYLTRQEDNGQVIEEPYYPLWQFSPYFILKNCLSTPTRSNLRYDGNCIETIMLPNETVSVTFYEKRPAPAAKPFLIPINLSPKAKSILEKEPEIELQEGTDFLEVHKEDTPLPRAHFFPIWIENTTDVIQIFTLSSNSFSRLRKKESAKDVFGDLIVGTGNKNMSIGEILANLEETKQQLRFHKLYYRDTKPVKDSLMGKLMSVLDESELKDVISKLNQHTSRKQNEHFGTIQVHSKNQKNQEERKEIVRVLLDPMQNHVNILDVHNEKFAIDFSNPEIESSIQFKIEPFTKVGLFASFAPTKQQTQ